MILKLIKDFYWDERKKWLKLDTLNSTIRCNKAHGQKWLKTGCFLEVEEEWTDSEIEAAVEKYKEQLEDKSEVAVKLPEDNEEKKK